VIRWLRAKFDAEGKEWERRIRTDAELWEMVQKEARRHSFWYCLLFLDGN